MKASGDGRRLILPTTIDDDNNQIVIATASTLSAERHDEEGRCSIQGSDGGDDDAISRQSSMPAKPTDSHQQRRLFVLTFEVPMFLFCVAYGIFNPAQQEFIYHRICLYKYNQSQQICSQIDEAPSLSALEDAVQDDYSVYSIINSLCIYPPAMLTTIVMGMWCDRFSHRLPFILPIVGSMTLSLFYLFYFYTPALNQSLNPIYLGFSSLIVGFTGSTVTAISAAYSYIGSATRGESRLVRLGIMQATGTLGVAVGYFVTAYMFKGSRSKAADNYLLAFVIHIALSAYAILTAFLFVPELRSLKQVKENVDKEARGSWIRYLCAPQSAIVEGFRILFRKSAIRRYRLWLLLTYFFACAVIPSSSVQTVLYAFLSLQPISLSPFSFALFQAGYALAAGFSLTCLLPLLRRKFGDGSILPISDAAAAVIGFISRIVAMILLGFGDFYPAIAPWLFITVNMFESFAFISMRSGLSKLTSQSDQGRLFAMLSLCESVAQLLANLGYNALYGTLVASINFTTTTSSDDDVLALLIHGYTFFFIAGLCITPLLMVIWLGKQAIKDWSFHSSSKKSITISDDSK